MECVKRKMNKKKRQAKAHNFRLSLYLFRHFSFSVFGGKFFYPLPILHPSRFRLRRRYFQPSRCPASSLPDSGSAGFLVAQRQPLGTVEASTLSVTVGPILPEGVIQPPEVWKPFGSHFGPFGRLLVAFGGQYWGVGVCVVV